MCSKFNMLLGLEKCSEIVLTKSHNLASAFIMVVQCIVCSARQSSPRSPKPPKGRT